MPAQPEASCELDRGAGRWVLVSTILASSMVFIDSSALNVALPVLQKDLGASGVQLLWVVNAYLLMLSSLMLIGGTLGDRLGRNRVCSAGIILFALGSLGGGLAPGSNFLIGARFLQGAGGALMIPGSLAIITACFMAGSRGRAIGTWAGATTIVTVAGPVLGGLLASAGLWRGVFLLNLPLAVVTLSILRFRVPESRDPNPPSGLDIPGAVIAAGGMAALTWGFLSAPGRGFGDPPVLAALAAGAALLIVFIPVELRSRHPMMPLGMFRSRDFAGANLLTFLLYGGLSMGMFFLSLNLIQVQGYSPALAGFAFLPFAAGIAGLSRWAGGLVARTGPRLPLIAGPSIAGAGLLMLAMTGLTGGASDYWLSFFPGIAVFGAGMGVTVAPLTTTVMSALEPHYAGTASGVNNSVSRIAGVFTIALLGSLALVTFTDSLEERTAAIDLSPEARQALMAQADRLGDTQVPGQVPLEAAGEVDRAISLSFVDTFRLILVICAVIAWLSAAAAAILVERLPPPPG